MRWFELFVWGEFTWLVSRKGMVGANLEGLIVSWKRESALV